MAWPLIQSVEYIPAEFAARVGVGGDLQAGEQAT
jgi:hypothetical protein